jgi:hypothetical protein
LRSATFGATGRAIVAEPARRRANDPILGLPGEIKPLRIALYVILVLTAASALFLEPALAGAVHRGAVSAIWLFLPLGLYGVFFTVYAIDRWFLVKRRNFPAGRAFFQVAFGVVFGLLLLPSTMGDWMLRQPVGMERLLSHPDAEVRSVAVEALGFRGFSPARVSMLIGKLEDHDPRVREAAAAVLAKWSNKDPEDLAGIQDWARRLSATSSTTEGSR